MNNVIEYTGLVFNKYSGFSFKLNIELNLFWRDSMKNGSHRANGSSSLHSEYKRGWVSLILKQSLANLDMNSQSQQKEK